MTGDSRTKFVVFIVVLVALHFVLRVGLGLGPFAPDLLVVALLVAARRVRPGTAAGLGAFLGLLDGAVTYVIGPSSLVLAVLGYAASRTRETLAGDSPVMLILYLFAGKWLYDVLLYAVLVWSDKAPPASSLLLVSPVAALYAAAAGLAAVALYRSVA
jgi:rod shape-determining protein MreD